MNGEGFVAIEGRRMDEATGEAAGMGLRVAFDRRLKLEFHGATVTSDAGLLAFRELDDALGLTALAGDILVDPRTGKNERHTLLAQFRQAVFGRLAGYEDVNDADRLGRGTAEQWIKEGKNAVKWTRLSCVAFRANAVRLQLHALAYNLANFLRTLALPREVAEWSLTSLREKVVKIGAKVVAHGRYLVFQMAEVAVPQELFRRLLDRIAGLRPPAVARC